MMKSLGIALGAGVTSAVLFGVLTTATPVAILFAYLAPLPIMIAGLGYAHPAGAVAALIGSGTVGVAMGPVAGLLFLLTLALPAAALSHLAVRGAAATAGSSAGPTPPPDGRVARLLLWLVALASVPVLLAGLALVWRFGSYAAAVSGGGARFEARMSREGLTEGLRLGDLVRYAPVLVAASGTLLLSINLWLAARTVQISGRLPRPWPSLPDSIRLPRAAAGLLVLLVAAAFLPGPAGAAAAVVAGALAVVFVFQGLAALHVVTRGLAVCGAILGGLYLVTVFVVPWCLIALAVLGCLDCLVPGLRGRAGMVLTKPPKRRN